VFFFSVGGEKGRRKVFFSQLGNKTGKKRKGGEKFAAEGGKGGENVIVSLEKKKRKKVRR